MKKKQYKCRVCHKKNTENLELNKIGRYSYLWRDKNWINIFCKSCGSISHYIKDKSEIVKYSDSTYRTKEMINKPLMPISLPWSTVTCLDQPI